MLVRLVPRPKIIRDSAPPTSKVTLCAQGPLVMRLVAPKQVLYPSVAGDVQAMEQLRCLLRMDSLLLERCAITTVSGLVSWPSYYKCIEKRHAMYF